MLLRFLSFTWGFLSINLLFWLLLHFAPFVQKAAPRYLLAQNFARPPLWPPGGGHRRSDNHGERFWPLLRQRVNIWRQQTSRILDRIWPGGGIWDLEDGCPSRLEEDSYKLQNICLTTCKMPNALVFSWSEFWQPSKTLVDSQAHLDHAGLADSAIADDHHLHIFWVSWPKVALMFTN